MFRRPTVGERAGLLSDGAVHGLRGAARLLDLLGDGGGRLAEAAASALADPAEVVSQDEASLRAPIPVPPSIRDFMAFEDHIGNIQRSRGRDVEPGWYQLPVFYFTNPAAVHGPADDVAISPGSQRFDYELEVAAVIGREGRDLSPEQAEGHIAGYLILSDWSARDLQEAEMTQRLGPAKGKDSATSLGPALVTPDELAHLSQGQRLRPGDDGLGQRTAVQRRESGRYLLVVRPDDLLRFARDARGARRRHRQRHRGNRVHPGTVWAPWQRQVPVVAAGRPGQAGRRPSRYHLRADPARRAGRPVQLIPVPTTPALNRSSAFQLAVINGSLVEGYRDTSGPTIKLAPFGVDVAMARMFRHSRRDYGTGRAWHRCDQVNVRFAPAFLDPPRQPLG